jgi:hypothetical protein
MYAADVEATQGPCVGQSRNYIKSMFSGAWIIISTVDGKRYKKWNCDLVFGIIGSGAE